MISSTGASGVGVVVAVVDSGVHADHPHIGTLAGGVGFDEAGVAHDDYTDRLGHGTAVTAAIHDLAPDAVVWALKVFDRTLETSLEALVAAIDWAGAHDVPLVNLSLGSREPVHAGPLRDAVARVSRRTVVIAAGTDDGVAWLPGTLDGVLGVELDWSCPRGRFRVGGTTTAPRLRTSGYPRPIPGVDPERNLKGLSFAVAGMTGLAARVLADTGVRGHDALIGQLVQRAC